MTVQKIVDVVVIGGGAGGLAAAIEARRRGAHKVLILERSAELGGILHQCIHTGFGLHYFKENLSGPEYISRFIDKVHELKIHYILETTVLKIFPNLSVQAMNSTDGLLDVEASAIVLAMGCREKPRGAIRIPGTRPAGILTAGTAQRLMDIEGYLPGRRIVILGSGDVGLIMARRLVMEGVRVEAVIEMMAYPGGLHRNVVQCLEDFGIPLLLNHTVINIHGKDRLASVTIAQVNDNKMPIPGTERRIECDTLILSVGLIPENELSTDLGLLLDVKTGGPIVNEAMETSVEGVFACGNVVHVNDLVDHVSWSGEKAGKYAAECASNRWSRSTRRIALRVGLNVRYVVPQFISGENPFMLYLRVKRPERNVMIKVGNAFNVFRRIVKPPEIIAFKLPKLDKIVEDAIEVTVRRRN